MLRRLSSGLILILLVGSAIFQESTNVFAPKLTLSTMWTSAVINMHCAPAGFADKEQVACHMASNLQDSVQIALFLDCAGTIPATVYDWDGVSEGQHYEWSVFVYNTGSTGLYITYLPTDVWFDTNQTHFIITCTVVQFGIPCQLSDVNSPLPEKDYTHPTNGYWLPAAHMIKVDVGLYVASTVSGSSYDWYFTFYGATGSTRTIYIRADGSIDPPDAPISTVDNLTYIFTGNITSDADGIVVERSNIIIDGAGYTLQGSGSGYGFSMAYRVNVTIENTNIKNFNYGIDLRYYSSYNSVIGNNVTANNRGISLGYSSNYNSMSGNNMTDNGAGIYVHSSWGNSISGNNVTANNYAGIMFDYYSSNNSVSGNSIADGDYGIFLSSSSSSSISGNTFTNDGLYVWGSFSCQNSVENNTVNGRPLVYLEGVSNYSVKDAGQVILVRCENIRAEGLNLSGTTVGIELLETGNSTISGNSMTANNFHGIFLSSSSNNSISRNNITDNNYCGIVLGDSSNNSISGNNITDNNYGIYPASSSSNRVFHNNFINNTFQFNNYNSTNIWDDGYPSGGNYWSDYTGVDANGDGIGDTPYVIDTDNQDHYPLINPWTPTPPAPDFSISASPTSLTIQQGSSDSSIITIASINDFDQLVTLTKAGMPSGVTALLSSQFVAPGPGGSETSTLTVTVDSTAAPGSYSITVNGTSGSLTHGTEIYLNIVIAEPLEISVTVVQDPDFGIYSARMHIYNKDSQSYTVAYGFLTANDEVLNVANYVRGTMNLQYVIPDNPFEMLPSANAFFDIVFDPRESADLGALTNAKLKIEYSTEWGNIVKYETLHFETFDYVTATDFNMTKDAYNFSNNEWEGDGKCYGMAATSILYFNGKIALPQGRTTYSLGIDEARANVDAYQDSYWLNKWSTGLIGRAGNILTQDKYSVLKQTILKGEPMIFIMSKQEPGKTIHAVTAYKILETKTMAYIIIYDNIWSYTYSPYDTTMSFRYITYDFGSRELRYEGYSDFKLVEAKKDPWWRRIEIGSAGELRVYDSENRITGVVGGEVKQEIPLSLYEEENETITIFCPDDIYRYTIVGISNGSYGLRITSVENGNTTSFSAVDIPLHHNEIHCYTVDWAALSQGEEGATVQVDSDGNGLFEYRFTCDSELTRTEFDFFEQALPWQLGSTKLKWSPVLDFAVHDGTLFAASDSKLGAYYGGNWSLIDTPTYVTSLETYEDKLIVGGRGGLYYYNGTACDLIFSVPTYVKVLGIYDSTLYAGTMLDNPPQLYYCNGSAENPADWYVETGFSSILNFSGAFGSVDSFAVYNGKMYVASGNTVYYFDGTGWSVALSYEYAYAFLDMQVYNGKLYLATRDLNRIPLYVGGTGFSGTLIEFDGENWTTVLGHDYWIYSLEEYDGKLYVGTANRIYTFDGTVWNVSFYSADGAYYAMTMITYNGKIYAGMGNGYIFADPVPAKTNPETVTVPEFPATAILAVFMALTMLAVALTRKNRSKRFS